MITQLKLALRILRRRKFFTFISLFGISFTIMALVVIAAMGEAALGDKPPLSKRDRLVFATHFRSERVEPDSSYIIDSVLVDGRMEYDSTLQVGEEVTSDNNSGLGIHLYETYLQDVESAVNQTFNAPAITFDSYLSGRKVTLSGNYTDAQYWTVLDYTFLHGRPYTREEFTAGAKVVVLADEAAVEYFGTAGPELIGRNIELGDARYEIVGILARPYGAMAGSESDLFLPYTTAPPNFQEVEYHGPGYAIFEAPTKAGRAVVVSELAQIAGDIQALPDQDRNRFFLEGLNYFQEFAGTFDNPGKNRDRALAAIGTPVLILLVLLVLLPALNLMNINVSRVYERSAEIAVRKSFGATDGDILRQFVCETLVVTLVGGVLGAALAVGLVALINGQRWLGDFTLRFTPEVIAYSLIIMLVFALLTGLLPAWRMAQTRIATSLR